MWGKNVSFTVIRPQRYTKEFIDNSNYFSLCFFNNDYKKTLSYLGSVSGRHEDKIDKSKLNIINYNDIPFFSEAKLVLICKKIYSQEFEEKNLQVQCDLDEVEIFSASGYLEIVWNNLLSNAVKFTDEGGRVSLSLTADDTHATVTVKDTGCGISPEVGAHIFDKFYQGDTSHATEGNGLGLALVKRVVDITKGEIGVQSTVGVGTAFTVKLRRNG